MSDKPHVEEVVINPDASDSVKKQLIEAEIQNAKQGRLAGLVVIVLGAILTVMGATGVVDLGLGGLGMKAQVANASPGVVAFLVGLAIIWRTNLSIKALSIKAEKGK